MKQFNIKCGYELYSRSLEMPSLGGCWSVGWGITAL